MKRAVIFRNGSNEDGKVILLRQSVEDVLTIAGTKLGINARRLYTKQGGEVDDTAVIRDDETLYVSAGEPFSAPEPHNLSLTTISIRHDWITLNVGGKYFTTTKSTLMAKEPNSMLARMFASNESDRSLIPSNVDQSGAFLIDRSPLYFEPILNFLRHGELILDKNVNPQGVLEEAKFFGIESIIPQLEGVINDEEDTNENSALTRRDVIKALICTSHSSELRFQGVNLAGADLSRLDLRFINFKYANLQRCNLSGANLAYCCLERADLSHANIRGANLIAVKMLCANLESAILSSCNFEDPAGSHANMEGVNLKGVNMEGSHMAGVNLRVATLKNANLQNCDLRGAVLAGADLENCDLSGSDLHEANLRGANLKDAAFELMLTPLHMSQTMFNTIR